VLPHEPVHVDTKAELKDKEEGKDKESGRDITVLDWHPASTYLASGTFEGVVRIWDSAGEAAV
jgi:WD40 repeat protein